MLFLVQQPENEQKGQDSEPIRHNDSKEKCHVDDERSALQSPPAGHKS